MERIDINSSFYSDLSDGVIYGHFEYHKFNRIDKELFNSLAKDFYKFVEEDVFARPKDTIEYTAGINALESYRKLLDSLDTVKKE